MKEYQNWLETMCVKSLNDESLVKLNWAFVAALRKYKELEQSDWILLKERMPTKEEIGEKCLVYRILNDSQSLMAISIYDTFMLKNCNPEETWWRELPTPPNA